MSISVNIRRESEIAEFDLIGWDIHGLIPALADNVASRLALAHGIRPLGLPGLGWHHR